MEQTQKDVIQNESNYNYGNIDNSIYNYKYVIGVDEAGRGPLFGRVYTGAVILPYDDVFDKSKLKDSKKFTSKKKIKEVYDYIIENTNNLYEIDFADENEIDKYNILQATQRSMHRCIFRLITKLVDVCTQSYTNNKTDLFESILISVDGNYFNTFKYYSDIDCNYHIIKHKTLVKGDSICKEISAASILAKVSRDIYIDDFVNENPEYEEKYGLLSNKGYGTKKHIEGIRLYGYSPYHRKSFRLKS